MPERQLVGNLFEARGKIGARGKEYNEERPHSSLGYRTPAEFARRVGALQSPTAPSAPPLGPVQHSGAQELKENVV